MNALLVAKAKAGRRPKTLTNLRQYLTRCMLNREHELISQITPDDVEQWIDGAKSAWGRQTALNLLSSMFSFAVRRRWMASNPCDMVERHTIDHRVPKILSIDQTRSMLSGCSPKIRPWVVLGMFAGLRPSEAERLDWSAIRLTGADPCLVVDASASKIRRRRIVPLGPCAVAWLGLDWRPNGRVVSSHSTLRRLRRVAGVSAGMLWSQNVLRHTYASMRIGRGDDVGAVASQMGNSPTILLTHYRELVHRADAVAFWALLPKSN